MLKTIFSPRPTPIHAILADYTPCPRPRFLTSGNGSRNEIVKIHVVYYSIWIVTNNHRNSIIIPGNNGIQWTLQKFFTQRYFLLFYKESAATLDDKESVGYRRGIELIYVIILLCLTNIIIIYRTASSSSLYVRFRRREFLLRLTLYIPRYIIMQ